MTVGHSMDAERREQEREAKMNPTKLELQKACDEAADFIITNLDGANVKVRNHYLKVVKTLMWFADNGVLSKSEKATIKSYKPTSDKG